MSAVHPYKTRNSLNRQKRRHEIADTIDDIPYKNNDKNNTSRNQKSNRLNSSSPSENNQNGVHHAPMYRPVKEPFNEASAYQCLVQLEQELSQECDKYNNTGETQKQLDLTDVAYMKFTDVGREIFEKTNSHSKRSYYNKRRRDKSSSFSIPEAYQDNMMDNEEIDGMLNMLDPTVSSDRQHAIENPDRNSNFQNNENDQWNKNVFVENSQNYQQTAAQDSVLGTSISESTDLGISSQNIELSSQDGYQDGNPEILDFTRPPSESEVIIDFDGSNIQNTASSNTTTLPQDNSTKFHKQQPPQQFVQEGNVLKLCSTSNKHTSSKITHSQYQENQNSRFVDPSDVYPENRPSKENLETNNNHNSESSKFNFTIRNTEDDYRKARYIKLMERRSQVQSAVENHRIMIQSLENLLNQQRAKLAHDEQTLRVLDNELSKIQEK